MIVHVLVLALSVRCMILRMEVSVILATLAGIANQCVCMSVVSDVMHLSIACPTTPLREW